MPDPPPPNTNSRPDRRRSIRICCSGAAEGVSDQPGHLFRGELRNISETGCFISVRASLRLPPGACVQLRFRLGRAEYNAVARVIETLPSSGLRLHFIATDPAFIDRIRQIVRPDRRPAAPDLP
ncbi:PilZ domain-containing protein [Occallatibacter savannae]|uniref:PilZ domain-containing protein n=1 Tax=Occallatibacter savannae TaxID=1002691 RepID=UPI000D69FB7D|nr:PilZ domain-containing protein [Occallatibacter savannae]